MQMFWIGARQSKMLYNNWSLIRLGLLSSTQWSASTVTSLQGYSLGLERLSLETVSRRFFERLGLVSVSRLQRLDLVSASYV